MNLLDLRSLQITKIISLYPLPDIERVVRGFRFKNGVLEVLDFSSSLGHVGALLGLQYYDSHSSFKFRRLYM